MRVNNTSNTSVNNKLSFSSIKKIKLRGDYVNNPKLTEDVLYIYTHKYFMNTNEFLKKHDVNLTLSTHPKRNSQNENIWELLADGFCEHIHNVFSHRIEFKILPKNSSFFKSLFGSKEKIKIETFDSSYGRTTPPVYEMVYGAEKLNKELARFVPDEEKIYFKPLKTVYIKEIGQIVEARDYSIFERGSGVAVESDSAKMGQRVVLKYHNNKIKKNETNYIHKLDEEQKKLTHYNGYDVKYSSFEYYPNGNIKEYVVVGEEQECFGEFYKNGKRKCDLVLNKEHDVEGVRPYLITTGRLKTYDDSGVLLKDIIRTKENWYTPMNLLYESLDERSSVIKRNALHTIEKLSI